MIDNLQLTTNLFLNFDYRSVTAIAEGLTNEPKNYEISATKQKRLTTQRPSSLACQQRSN